MFSTKLTVIEGTEMRAGLTGHEDVIEDTEIDRLAWDVERAGLTGHEDVIERIIDRARPSGVNPVLVGVLADRAEPENARIRAFGRVALQLGARPLATAA